MKKLAIGRVALLSACLLPSISFASDEYQELKREIDLLNKKLESLEASSKHEDAFLQRKLSAIDSLNNGVKFHGFLSAGFATLAGKDRNSDLNLLGTHKYIDSQNNLIIGTQVDIKAGNALSASVQFVGRGSDDDKISSEWAYVAYHATDDLVMRAGRLREPFYAFSETLDVGFTYPWVSPPIEVYYLPLNHYEGVDARWSYDASSEWRGHIQAYYGSAITDEKYFTQSEYNLRDLWGAVLSFDREVLTVRAAIHQTHLDISPMTDGVADQLMTGLSGADKLATGINAMLSQAAFFSTYTPDITTTPATFANAAAIYDGDWFVAAEYTRLVTHTVLVPSAQTGYVTVGKHLGKWLPFVSLATVYSSKSYDKRINSSIAHLHALEGFLRPLGAAVIDSDSGTTALGAADDIVRLQDGLRQFRLQQDSYSVGLNYTLAEGLKAKAQVTEFNDFGGTRGTFSGALPGKNETLYSLVLNAAF